MRPHTPIFVAATIAAATFSTTPRSQAPALPTPGAGSVAGESARLPADLVVPIHTHPADPTFGEYGVWAGGAGYKVRFGDDVTFFPRLGKSAPRNLPLTWRTRTVTVGGRVLVDADVVCNAGATGPTRFEYRRGPVVEAYDVRADGIEQTFVLAQRPAIAGDLVVEGTLSTELLADSTRSLRRT